MKGFIAAVITLSLLCGGVIFNTFFIRRETDHLLSLLDSIPESPLGENAVALCDEFSDKWGKFSKLLLLTVDHKAVEDIEDTVATLSSYAKTKSEDSFAAALALLKEEIIHLRMAELFSFAGIF